MKIVRTISSMNESFFPSLDRKNSVRKLHSNLLTQDLPLIPSLKNDNNLILRGHSYKKPIDQL